jgi:putative membrane protein (TIGR04086 family)
MEKKKGILINVLLALLFMVFVTVLLLLAGAALVYYKELSAKTAYIMIDVIYAIVGLTGGFFMGKMRKTRKFLWGIMAGLCYFGILLLVSLVTNGGTIEDMVQVLITFVLIEASAMIGGMIS